MADRASDRSNSLVESHKGYDPRIIFFYFFVVVLLLVLVGGLAYQQLIKTDIYHEREKQQNQRRILVPGPRGNIYDREGRLLVYNRPRYAVTLFLDELRKEFRRQYIQVRKNYRETGDKDLPNFSQMELIARFAVVQGYLDQINAALGRREKVDAEALNRHFQQRLLLPFTLLDDLTAEEFARLSERLPVRSPLQLSASSLRFYPYGSAAAHTLGSVTSSDEVDAPDFPGDELTTFKMKGTTGRDGLEHSMDEKLQGEAGGSIYRVDPAGYRIEPPLQRRLPVQGQNLVTSLDIDLQLAAEKALTDMELAGAAVALDVNTGEVLAIATKPDYNLSDFTPRLSHAKYAEIEGKGAWLNRAVNGLYPPGSTFKILVSVAGLRAGTITPESTVNCTGHFFIGKSSFPCHGGHAHGEIDFRNAVAKSCNVFFYQYGLDTTPDTIAAEGRRFGMGSPTGIELPSETRRTIMPTPEWKEKTRSEKWFPGNTANMAIGQGDVLVTPLQMACFTASIARGQTITKPTLIHSATHSVQRSESIGLTTAQYSALIEGMERCTQIGAGHTGAIISKLYVKNARVAAKTGTAQKDVYDPVTKKKGTINYAWFICFAPVENPEIALAVVAEGDKPDEEFAGGAYAGPVAGEILKKFFEKKARASQRGLTPPASPKG